MADHQGKRRRQIGELAKQAGTSTDTVRYYERRGLLEEPNRTASGYRLYTDADLGRLRFVRQARSLGLTLNEIQGLLGVAAEGQCQPLRWQIAELLARKIEECAAQLAELERFKASLEAWRRLALERANEPACRCNEFPATCGCLPVQSVGFHGQPTEAPDE